ncbi:hypothetical protein BDV12DRAFT_34218 [Aspergillus spectabilis]
MASVSAGVAVSQIFTPAPLLGFVPVAVHFKLFDVLVGFDKPASGEEVLAAYKEQVSSGEEAGAVPGLLLIQDTLFAMAALGVIDQQEDNLYSSNALTQHLVAHPSALHGAMCFTTEMLFASAFLMPKLKADNFTYPFRDNDTPMQHAYKLMGNDNYANKNTYQIMAEEGRMDSFNSFMVGKFFRTESNPDRLVNLGYDLAAVLYDGPSTSTQMVDIGGGRGEMLLEFKDAIPTLQPEDLIVAEFNDDLGDIPGLTFVRWNYKDDTCPQPIQGALIYHLAHVLHNLPDLDAVRLLQKIRDAMAPYSRLLIHEFVKSVDIGFLHASMTVLFGGRERTPEEFRKMADAAGLDVTFEAFPAVSDGLMELRRV